MLSTRTWPPTGTCWWWSTSSSPSGALAVRRLRSWASPWTSRVLTSSLGLPTSVNATKASALNQAVLDLVYRRLTHQMGYPQE